MGRQQVESTGAPLVLPDKNMAYATKNSASTVDARKAALEMYLNDALALSKRLGSAALAASIDAFFAPAGSPLVAGGPVAPAATVWDVVGRWMHYESVSFAGVQAKVPHSLQLAVDGGALFEARGHPIHSGAVRATGSWSSQADGTAVRPRPRPAPPGCVHRRQF
jgi:hypothetical protein